MSWILLVEKVSLTVDMYGPFTSEAGAMNFGDKLHRQGSAVAGMPVIRSYWAQQLLVPVVQEVKL